MSNNDSCQSTRIKRSCDQVLLSLKVSDLYFFMCVRMYMFENLTNQNIWSACFSFLRLDQWFSGGWYLVEVNQEFRRTRCV